MNCSFCAAAGAMNAVARTAAPATPKSLSVIVDLLADRASQERIAGHCSRGKHLVYEAKPRLRAKTSFTRRNLVYEAEPRSCSLLVNCHQPDSGSIRERP